MNSSKSFSPKLLLVAGVILAATSFSHAASIGHLRDASGGEGPFHSGAVLDGAGSINSWNGRAGTLDFELSLNGENGTYLNLLTYCGDPFRPLHVGPAGGAGNVYNIVSMASFFSSALDILAIEKLWSLAYTDSRTSATKAAAFQFLLWEVIADPAIDFAGGAVRIYNSDVLSQASAWKEQLNTSTARAILQVLDGRDAGRQSFFFEQQASRLIENPEPSTYALIGAGLISLRYLRRRR